LLDPGTHRDDHHRHDASFDKSWARGSGSQRRIGLLVTDCLYAFLNVCLQGSVRVFLLLDSPMEGAEQRFSRVVVQYQMVDQRGSAFGFGSGIRETMGIPVREESHRFSGARQLKKLQPVVAGHRSAGIADVQLLTHRETYVEMLTSSPCGRRGSDP